MTQLLTSEVQYRIDKRRRELAWQAENRETIDAYNERIERDGLWHERFHNSR